MDLNRENVADLFRGYNTAFKRGLQASMEVNRRSFTYEPPAVVGSSSVYPWVTQLPQVRQWIGERQLRRISGLKLEIANLPFESTVRVNRDNVEDDTYGVYAPLFEGMGQEGVRWKEQFCFGVLAGAFSTVCWDGQYAVDTDHPVLDASGTPTTVSNSGGGSGNPWFLVDASRGIFKPVIFQTRKDFNLVALDQEKDANVFYQRELIYGMDGRFNAAFAFWQLLYGSKQTVDSTAYNTAKAAFQAQVTDYGKPLGLKATHIVCGNSNEAAFKAVLAERLANGASNPNYNDAQLVVTPYLP
jgi:phage major head subunit gpT-like protein